LLFVHDVHAVMGERELDFEDALRDEYAGAVADDDTRLLWYFNSTHGAGEAYKVVTITAVRDGAAWERLVERLRRGDLSGWAGRAEAMRYGLTSSLLVPVPWSPLADLDLATVPVGPQEHPAALYREDALTGSGIDVIAPGGAPAAVPAAASGGAQAGADADAVMTCVAALAPAIAPGDALRILYRIDDQERWTAAFGTDAGWHDWPGSLTPTLPDQVRGSSRTLRTTTWSPWP
jgi:hypothetical protein